MGQMFDDYLAKEEKEFLAKDAALAQSNENARKLMTLLPAAREAVRDAIAAKAGRKLGRLSFFWTNTGEPSLMLGEVALTLLATAGSDNAMYFKLAPVHDGGGKAIRPEQIKLDPTLEGTNVKWLYEYPLGQRGAYYTEEIADQLCIRLVEFQKKTA